MASSNTDPPARQTLITEEPHDGEVIRLGRHVPATHGRQPLVMESKPG
jgi:hypothetical protein